MHMSFQRLEIPILVFLLGYLTPGLLWIPVMVILVGLIGYYMPDID